jgi:metallo-beta-lactamase family protein
MAVAMSFLGAARNVTGSCVMLENGAGRILIDCGLYQERDLKPRNWEPLPVPPAEVDAIVLTHAHLDHCGRIPKLVRDGFRGPVFSTAVTAELAAIILRDSARIQEEDIAYKQKRHAKEGRKSPHPYEPLYDSDDAEAAIARFRRCPYGEEVDLPCGMTARFSEAGHIFGSTFIHLRPAPGGREFLFSGDTGRKNLPLQRDPAPAGRADFLLCESTYGDRLHEPTEAIPDQLARVINETVAAGGSVVIPSFAVERSQELLFYMSALLKEKRIPRIPVYLDSPMAVRVTDVFRQHPELFDEETSELVRRGEHPCDFPGLRMTPTVEDSKAINRSAGSAVIIAGSGMCTGGRIKHHLKHHIVRPESTVLFVGYQAFGTLGRIIVDGAEEVRIHGEMHPVKARIAKISGFSAHADREELIEWLETLENEPERCYITHGEEQAALAFRDALRERFGWEAVVPHYLDRVEIEGAQHQTGKEST